MVHVHGWDAGTDAWEPLASTRLRQQQIAEDPAPPRTLPMPPALAAIMAEQRHAHHTVSGINVLVNAKEVALKTQRREDLCYLDSNKQYICYLARERPSNMT